MSDALPRTIIIELLAEVLRNHPPPWWRAHQGGLPYDDLVQRRLRLSQKTS